MFHLVLRIIFWLTLYSMVIYRTRYSNASRNEFIVARIQLRPVNYIVKKDIIIYYYLNSDQVPESNTAP